MRLKLIRHPGFRWTLLLPRSWSISSTLYTRGFTGAMRGSFCLEIDWQSGRRKFTIRRNGIGKADGT